VTPLPRAGTVTPRRRVLPGQGTPASNPYMAGVGLVGAARPWKVCPAACVCPLLAPTRLVSPLPLLSLSLSTALSPYPQLPSHQAAPPHGDAHTARHTVMRVAASSSSRRPTYHTTARHCTYTSPPITVCVASRGQLEDE